MNNACNGFDRADASAVDAVKLDAQARYWSDRLRKTYPEQYPSEKDKARRAVAQAFEQGDHLVDGRVVVPQTLVASATTRAQAASEAVAECCCDSCVSAGPQALSQAAAGAAAGAAIGWGNVESLGVPQTALAQLRERTARAQAAANPPALPYAKQDPEDCMAGKWDAQQLTAMQVMQQQQGARMAARAEQQLAMRALLETRDVEGDNELVLVMVRLQMPARDAASMREMLGREPRLGVKVLRGLQHEARYALAQAFGVHASALPDD